MQRRKHTNKQQSAEKGACEESTRRKMRRRKTTETEPSSSVDYGRWHQRIFREQRRRRPPHRQKEDWRGAGQRVERTPNKTHTRKQSKVAIRIDYAQSIIPLLCIYKTRTKTDNKKKGEIIAKPPCTKVHRRLSPLLWDTIHTNHFYASNAPQMHPTSATDQYFVQRITWTST